MDYERLDIPALRAQFVDPLPHPDSFDFQTIQDIEHFQLADATARRIVREHLPKDEFALAQAHQLEQAKLTIIVAAYYLNGGNRESRTYAAEKGPLAVAKCLEGKILESFPVVADFDPNRFWAGWADLAFLRYTRDDGTQNMPSDILRSQDRNWRHKKSKEILAQFARADLAILATESIHSFACAISSSLHSHRPFSLEGQAPTLFESIARTVFAPPQIERLIKNEEKYNANFPSFWMLSLAASSGKKDDGVLLTKLYQVIAGEIY